VITFLGSVFDTSTRTVTSSATCYFSVSSSSSRKAARIRTATSLHGFEIDIATSLHGFEIDTTTSLHDFERGDYTNKRYVD
jgi:hypothetical protein